MSDDFPRDLEPGTSWTPGDGRGFVPPEHPATDWCWRCLSCNRLRQGPFHRHLGADGKHCSGAVVLCIVTPIQYVVRPGTVAAVMADYDRVPPAGRQALFLGYVAVPSPRETPTDYEALTALRDPRNGWTT